MRSRCRQYDGHIRYREEVVRLLLQDVHAIGVFFLYNVFCEVNTKLGGDIL